MRFVFQIVVLFFSTTAAFAAPSLVMDSPSFDFGNVSQGKKVDHTFTFRNSGDEPLTVDKITSSCGCTAASLSSKTILPGRKGEIKVTFDSTNFSGHIRKTVSFETNDPRRKSATFTLSGNVQELLGAVPSQVDGGLIKAGTRKEMTFAIENRSDRPVAILNVTTQTAQIHATARDKSLPPGKSALVYVTLAPRDGERYVNGFVIVTTDFASKPELRIPVYGTVAK